MPKTSKIKKKVKKTKTKPIAKPKAKVTSKPKTKVIASKPKEAIKGPIKISRNYQFRYNFTKFFILFNFFYGIFANFSFKPFFSRN